MAFDWPNSTYLHYNGTNSKGTHICRAEYLNCDTVQFYYKFENISHFNVIAVATFNFIVSPFTTFFNFLALYTIYRRRKLQTLSNLILCNLALTDFLTGCLTQPFFGVLMLMSAFCVKFCFINTFTIIVGNLLSSVSMASLFLITLDRHLSIFYPFYYEKVKDNKQKLLIMIIGLWISNLGLVCAGLATPDMLVSAIGSSAFAALIFTWSLYVNIKTALVVRRIQRDIAAHTVSNEPYTNTRNRGRSEVSSRVTRVAFTILASMFICYLPFVGFALIEMRFQSPFNAWVWISTLVFLNSTINPLVYCWQMREIREEMKVIINKIFCCRTIEIWRDRFSTTAQARSTIMPAASMRASSMPL